MLAVLVAECTSVPLVSCKCIHRDSSDVRMYGQSVVSLVPSICCVHVWMWSVMCDIGPIYRYIVSMSGCVVSLVCPWSHLCCIYVRMYGQSGVSLVLIQCLFLLLNFISFPWSIKHVGGWEHCWYCRNIDDLFQFTWHFCTNLTTPPNIFV